MTQATIFKPAICYWWSHVRQYESTKDLRWLGSTQKAISSVLNWIQFLSQTDLCAQAKRLPHHLSHYLRLECLQKA